MRRRYSKPAPEKRKARLAVAYAVRSGALVRASRCERCLVECKTHGHHSDYSKPLLVRWLCASCHRAEHVATGTGRKPRNFDAVLPFRVPADLDALIVARALRDRTTLSETVRTLLRDALQKAA